MVVLVKNSDVHVSLNLLQDISSILRIVILDMLCIDLLPSFLLHVRIPSLYTFQYAWQMHNCIPCHFWSRNRVGLVCDEVHAKLLSFLDATLWPLSCYSLSFLDVSSDMEG